MTPKIANPRKTYNMQKIRIPAQPKCCPHPAEIDNPDLPVSAIFQDVTVLTAQDFLLPTGVGLITVGLRIGTIAPAEPGPAC